MSGRNEKNQTCFQVAIGFVIVMTVVALVMWVAGCQYTPEERVRIVDSGEKLANEVGKVTGDKNLSPEKTAPISDAVRNAVSSPVGDMSAGDAVGTMLGLAFPQWAGVIGAGLGLAGTLFGRKKSGELNTVVTEIERAKDKASNMVNLNNVTMTGSVYRAVKKARGKS